MPHQGNKFWGYRMFGTITSKFDILGLRVIGIMTLENSVSAVVEG